MIEWLIFVFVKCVGLIVATIVTGLLAKCGGPAPVVQPKPVEPCQQSGVSYAPVGRIVRMDQMPLKDRREYGTHVLLDASGNIQFVLQAPNLKLDPYSDDGKWYRVDGQLSPDHTDLFVVCAVSPSL